MTLLFCAAQAPDLLGRDQRYGVLPLYFSHALSRVDYALARVLGLMAALLGLVVLPQLVLFVGRVLAAPDPLAGIGIEAPSLPPAIVQGLLAAGLYGGIAALVSAFTPRRAYATAAIIALFIVPPIIVSLFEHIPRARGLTGWVVLTSATDLLGATNALLFDIRPTSLAIRSSDLPLAAYAAAVLLGIVGTVGLLIRRYLRIAA